MKKLAIPALIVMIFQGCYYEPGYAPAFRVGQVEGYEPIYVSIAESVISFETARALRQPGKIYLYGNFLLLNELQEGIHVYDNTDPSHPVARGFLKIPGNIDMAVRNGVLYVDHLGELVALNVSDWQHPVEISRVPLSHWVSTLPPAGSSYFECVDESKGKVSGWRLTTLNNPKCYR